MGISQGKAEMNGMADQAGVYADSAKASFNSLKTEMDATSAGASNVRAQTGLITETADSASRALKMTAGRIA